MKGPEGPEGARGWDRIGLGVLEETVRGMKQFKIDLVALSIKFYPKFMYFHLLCFPFFLVLNTYSAFSDNLANETV